MTAAIHSLSLLAWVVLSFLVYMLFFISRFYERKSGQASHYRYFLVPAVIFIACAFLELWESRGLAIHIICGLGRFVGAIILFWQVNFMITLMMGKKQ